MKDFSNLTAHEIEMMMIRLKHEYTRRRGEFSNTFATEWVEDWIDEIQQEGYNIVISNPGVNEEMTILPYDFISVTRE